MVCHRDEARAPDAIEEVGSFEAAIHLDACLEHEGPQLPHGHMGQLFRVVLWRLRLDQFHLFREGEGPSLSAHVLLIFVECAKDIKLFQSGEGNDGVVFTPLHCKH